MSKKICIIVKHLPKISFKMFIFVKIAIDLNKKKEYNLYICEKKEGN